MHTQSKDWGYLLLWEFQVRPGFEPQFEAIYGPDGEWAEFFQTGAGYVGTELVQDTEQPRRYVTLDFWASRECYETFKRQQAEQYRLIDEKCEQLTSGEVQFGAFERVRSR